MLWGNSSPADRMHLSAKTRGEELLAELETAEAEYLAALGKPPANVRNHDIALDVLRSLDALIRALRN